ncbi:MAG: bifunctional pantoate--beta-alanine ligase/(d)CMP kinase [Limnospira sp. PMC 1291.21]|uniref:Bifunctional pantoate ligase/cytidylate kinase n=3 Tax=Limnospira TaxID=2596745 RepID=A0A9P1KGE3_9CYAN|nr:MULTISPECIES: bifunctional pantoate--beta-alanine ligase/(d)CMP kinase [Limnospira]EKD06954.1 pantoate/beta-alanine ligase [Arthrospira platensis C1]MDC0840633.1 bifunctional pantoate--beta-alanine ligase/(d)CMP kinase [Limnoraphis robusta]MDY7053640.1 bifunctional pantoate--beta-alanine ligase/(d)CMP kinase [Limnospira fusiformis LS22]QJB26196.1 bifunctional pantoate--beta-alanine ligase/(d)CMP kinase [Limnospira fusiformis SAG 85.79]EDZ95624.1 pantoate/beta-alanine ligase [Limnospira maxi
MRLFTTVAAWRSYSQACHNRQIGLVPTMGGLHSGHLSLIRQARNGSDLVVVSIFVNPLQFGPREDFQKYPRNLEADLALGRENGVDVVFAPSVEEIYGSEETGNTETGLSQQTCVIVPDSLTSRLCGASRPGHFQGVTTIVAKLFNLIQPNRAYFGQKDAQQVAVIRRMVADLNWPIEIVACPIIREASGLAYSSRNQYLTREQKQQATVLYKALQAAGRRCGEGVRSRAGLLQAAQEILARVPGVKLEYLELVAPDTLVQLETVEEIGLLAIAASVGNTRLIDNIMLNTRQPIVAIDGPAGAGKSTVTRHIAQLLNLMYLDTGAMYRAITWKVLQSQISVDDEPAIAQLVSGSRIELIPDQDQIRVLIDGSDVTEAIRTQEVTRNVSAIAAQVAVRRGLVKQQQQLGRRGGLVAEGRDIGTHVFPDAELKIFLTASVEERAKRRYLELQQKGDLNTSLEEIKQDIIRRDELDSNRTIAPLRKAVDAIELSTDGLSIEQVTNEIVRLYTEHLKNDDAPGSSNGV